VLGGSSFQLGRIFGIRIGVNASWFFILFLFLFWLSSRFGDDLDDPTLGFIAAVIAAVLFFGSIVLHELGHALAARRSGIEVAGIDLFFFGGVMKMSRETDTPGREFFVAVAGPLVTLGIVIVGTVVGVVIAGGQDAFLDAALLDSNVPPLAVQLVSFLVTMNVILLVFNLVPAFPLDGGRIARAAIWKLTGDRARSTRISGYIGQGFAALLAGYGIYLLAGGDATSGLWLAVLGYLLWQSARGAVLQSAVTSRLEGVTVADIMDADPVTLPADLPVQQAYEDFFLRYQGWPWFAVVEPDGRYAGVAHRAAVESAARGAEPVPVRELAADSGEVRDDAPLEALLGSEPLRRLGALMAVDADGRLRGVVTLEQVSRALQARLTPRAG
jgi:Zn-dependent protease